MSLKILSVVGARPNFMKIAPFIRAINNHNQNPEPRTPNAERQTSNAKPVTSNLEPGTLNLEHLLVHTGQHYDDRMSEQFFRELNIPQADINLGVGSGSHAEQVGQTMIAFEKVLRAEKPDWVVVVGDVNATLACSVTAKKEWVKLCHIEAGLRSHDMKMPEEINRLVTDRLADLLLTPDELSSENLRKEGVPESKIRFVGNIMIDTLEANRLVAADLSLENIIMQNLTKSFELKTRIPENEKYAVLTLHRPSNVDTKEVLEPIVRFILDEVLSDITLLWTLHPRTLNKLKDFGLYEILAAHPNIILLEPVAYREMLRLNMGARMMLTDSGGLQEECTVLGTPCLTLRWNTERPVTLREYGGASVLVGNNIDQIRNEYYIALKKSRSPYRPSLWDGNTADRCLQAILENHLR
ncbi:MAG: UDP-N-acetylglucosamine 2-epimerase (non-hydrolyzing) [Bacteroidales bacterium]|nr:UDP-N-acetylglucosamine 2-epimerase (non-hydrolyzing) [Bacteroidales bacterium]